MYKDQVGMRAVAPLGLDRLSSGRPFRVVITSPARNLKLCWELGAGVMRNDLTAFGAKMEKVFGIECFSTDTRIILCVVESGSCNIKDAQYTSGLSHRGFYLKLKRLVDDGFISVNEDSTDGRKRLLVPTEKAKGLRLSLVNMHVTEDVRDGEPRLMLA